MNRMKQRKKQPKRMRFGVIVLACLAGACIFALVRSGKDEAPRPATAQEVALVPDGTQLVSPESGKPIRKNASTPALVFGGRLYFLCCAVCMQKCQADPRLLKDAKPPNGYDLRKLGGASQ